MKHGRLEKMQEAMESSYAQRKSLGNHLLEEWSKTDIGAGLSDLYTLNPHKARNVALAVELQEGYMKQHLNELLISTAFATTPENVLKIVRLGTANSIRGDAFTEYPLQTIDDAIYWIDMTREQTMRGATAGEKAYETVSSFYAGEQTWRTQVGDDDTSVTIECGTDQGGLTTIPIIGGKTFIELDGKLIATDTTTAGTLTPLTVTGTGLSSGTIDYTTGQVLLTMDASLSASNTITVIYNWDSENQTNFADNQGTIGISVRKQRFDARPMPLGYTFTDMTALTLSSTGLGDVHDMLIGQVGDEHAKRRDYRAIAQARSVANVNTVYTYNADFAAVGEVSANEHAQNILGKIDDIGGDIYDDIKRGGVNTAIAGSRALTYLKKHKTWKGNASARKEGPYEAGMIDNIRVFTCPTETGVIANNEVVLTFKNDQEGADVSIAFGNFTELQAELRYPSFRTDGSIATVEDSIIINSKFLRKLTINNLPS